MRIFFDTEFLDLGSTAQLISLGAVREDGTEFYAEASDVRWDLAQPWVLANVRPHLRGYEMSVAQLRGAFREWAFDATEFWAYYGTYDWWLVMQLFGGFQGLPPQWPHYFHELSTLIRQDRKADFKLPEQVGTAHNALDDARWNWVVYDYLMKRREE